MNAGRETDNDFGACVYSFFFFLGGGGGWGELCLDLNPKIVHSAFCV